jgi:hypothetical protein
MGHAAPKGSEDTPFASGLDGGVTRAFGQGRVRNGLGRRFFRNGRVLLLELPMSLVDEAERVGQCDSVRNPDGDRPVVLVILVQSGREMRAFMGRHSLLCRQRIGGRYGGLDMRRSDRNAFPHRGDVVFTFD